MLAPNMTPGFGEFRKRVAIGSMWRGTFPQLSGDFILPAILGISRDAAVAKQEFRNDGRALLITHGEFCPDRGHQTEALEFGRVRPEFGLARAESGVGVARVWSSPGRSRPKLAKFGRNPAELGQAKHRATEFCRVSTGSPFVGGRRPAPRPQNLAFWTGFGAPGPSVSRSRPRHLPKPRVSGHGRGAGPKASRNGPHLFPKSTNLSKGGPISAGFAAMFAISGILGLESPKFGPSWPTRTRIRPYSGKSRPKLSNLA